MTVVRYLSTADHRDYLDARSAVQRLANEKRRRVIWFWEGKRMAPIWPDVSVMMKARKERA